MCAIKSVNSLKYFTSFNSENILSNIWQVKRVRLIIKSFELLNTVPLVSGKMPPGKKPPGKMPPRKLPPGKLPPGNMPPRKIAPRKIAPQKTVLLDFLLLLTLSYSCSFSNFL